MAKTNTIKVNCPELSVKKDKMIDMRTAQARTIACVYTYANGTLYQDLMYNDRDRQKRSGPKAVCRLDEKNWQSILTDACRIRNTGMTTNRNIAGLSMECLQVTDSSILVASVACKSPCSNSLNEMTMTTWTDTKTGLPICNLIGRQNGHTLVELLMDAMMAKAFLKYLSNPKIPSFSMQDIQSSKVGPDQRDGYDLTTFTLEVPETNFGATFSIYKLDGMKPKKRFSQLLKQINHDPY